MTYTLDVKDKHGVVTKTLTATAEQAEIIDYIRANPKRNIVVNSLAGSAKTSTLQFLWKYLSVEPTISVAFNKRIVDEMVKIAPGHVKPATANSIGHRVVGAMVGKRLTLETKKNYNLVKEAIEELPRRERAEAYDCFGDMTKAMAQAKTVGYVPPSGPPGHSLMSQDDFYAGLEEAPDGWFIDTVDKCLVQGIRQAYAGLIDFDDQIYISVLFGGSFPSFARTMVDEAQDLNALNHVMIEKLVRDRWLGAVGDPWQSIYAFRGAVTSSMKRLIERFDAHEMTLSVSFRCPIKVIERAHSRVPHMKWPAWAIEGEVRALPEWSINDIPDHAAIICRNNAPLLTCAFALLRAGRGIHLVGTDLGPQLVRALKKLSDNPKLSRAEVLQAIDIWEQEKLRKARDAGSITDRAECLRVFANFGNDLGGAIAYAEHIFSAKGPIQLMSGHKSKGLEFDTVFHLDPQRIPSPYARDGEAMEQELNVRYVIETRPKKTLYLVQLEDFNEEVTNGRPKDSEVAGVDL